MTLLLHFAFECRVEVILDVIICTSFEMLGYFGPPITVLDVEVENFLVFFIRPFVLLNIRI